VGEGPFPKIGLRRDNSPQCRGPSAFWAIVCVSGISLYSRSLTSVIIFVGCGSLIEKADVDAAVDAYHVAEALQGGKP
jgi:hypothetical protein